MKYTRSQYKQRHKKSAIIPLVLAGICIITSGIFGYLAFAEVKENKDIDNMWENVRTFAIEDNAEIIDDGEIISAISEDEPETYAVGPLTRQIKWEELKSINEDVSSWVYIPDTAIDYPELQEQKSGQAFYLNHDLYKKQSEAGSIFILNENKNNDAYTLIFGHHLKNGSMFGSILNYKDHDYFIEHPYVYLYYPGRSEKWEIKLVSHIKSSNDLYKLTTSLSTEEYEEIIDSVYDTALNQTGTHITKNDKTLILSTCDRSSDGNNGRFIIMAVKVDSIEF